ncbi:DUF6600 domain-containing protein [Duganella sp. Dugasp56]|uniref:DUF6600 domain-containing protein n=1 Tax=Duganella sp. Dugasp56 TaxID=3243046 RepID=UPI0039AEB7A8
MSRNIIHSVVLAALAGFSALALADPPAMVGRISSVQGQVTLVGDDEPAAVGLNWPVTGASHINTATGARTEFRVGSTAVRIDGDSDLEIIDLDDDLLRLRLNYGSVNIRIRSPELLRDFELSTPQARITMLEPGLLRVDVERIADTSQISVLGGSARVDGAGSSVTVNNGRQVEVTGEDVRTSVARRDGFDVWSDERDRASEAVVSSRFVSSGMTGYEELDRNGSWTETVEYGALWTPRNVAVDWAPYRDGSWVWLAPWGWTWVDNAPWGYAPSHYGRWVMVNRRWCWAPGRPAGRPVWAPALVGWVGGDGFSRDRRPGLGWFPLSPRERYVPNYRVSNEYERRLTWTHNGRPFEPRGDQRRDQRGDQDNHRNGLTVLPREQFEGRRHSVQVNRGAGLIPTAQNAAVVNAAPVAPPQPTGLPRTAETNRRGGWQDRDRDHDGIPDRLERQTSGQPGRVLTAPPQPVPVPLQPGRQQTTTTLAPGQFGRPDSAPQTVRPGDVRIDVRTHGRPGQLPATSGQPQQGNPQVNAPVAMPAPVMQVSPTPTPSRERFERDGRDGRGDNRGDNRNESRYENRGDDNRRPVRVQEERRQVPQPAVQQPQIPQPQRQVPQPAAPVQAAPQAQPQPQQPQQPRQERHRDDGRERGDNKNQNRQ